MKANELTAKALRDQLREKKLSVREALTDLYSAIEADNKTNQPVAAYTELYQEEALKNADALQARIDAGEALPLLGVPVSLKDNIAYEGHDLECASKFQKGYVAPFNATVTDRLLNAGAIIAGRLNMDEFAMGSSTETSAVHITRNPVDRALTPGGSSGGAAAAIKANHAFLALGSDSAGSIRQPASFCGVVGFKPSYGRVSRHGLVSFAPSFDQIGPLAKSVEDAAMIMDVIAGHDPNDAMSIETPAYSAPLSANVAGLSIGVPKEYFDADMDDVVRKRVMDAIDVYRALGAEVKPVSLPHTNYAMSVYYALSSAEASSALARFDGVRFGVRSKNVTGLGDLYEKSRSEGFGDEVQRRIILGTYLLSADQYEDYYVKALKVRTLLIRDFADAFKDVDALISPTAPTVAFPFGTHEGEQMRDEDTFTVGANIAGLPAVSVPTGGEGLPVGVQIIGRQFDEKTPLTLAYAYEQALR